MNDAHEFIASLRLDNQSKQLQLGEKASNTLDPRTISPLFRHQRKDAFSVVAESQKALKARFGPLEKLYSSLPNLNGRIALGKILVVDLEMTGLDPKVDQILSFGWIAINDGFIEYSSGQHKRCYAQEAVGNSVVIHGLSDQQVAGASSISAAMSLLLNEMIGCTLVFHHASLDIAFLQKASLECFGAPLLFPYLYTMTLEQKMLERSGKAGPLQLDRCLTL